MYISPTESQIAVPRVKHESNWPSKTIIQDLLTSGANNDSISQVVDTEGRWAIVPLQVDLYQAEGLEEILNFFGQKLSPIYYCGQLSIVQAYGGLFNSHTWDDHVRQVTGNATRLGTEAGLEDESVMTIGISASGHDLGILQRRKTHSLISPRLFSRVFPKLLEDNERWREVERAIVLHDEGAYRRMGLHGEKLHDRLKTMRAHGASEVSAALVIADKFDIHPRRVWHTACTEEGMDNHFHSVINLAAVTTNYGLNPNTGKFEIILSFSPTIPTQEQDKYKHIITREGYNGFHYYVPKSFREDEKDQQSPVSFDKTWKYLLKLYGPSEMRTATSRFELAIDNIYLLHPDVNEVSMTFLHPYCDDRKELVFTRETIDTVWDSVASNTNH